VFAAAVTVLFTACASPAPPELEERIARAGRGHADDPAIQARLFEVEAAREHERSVTPIEDFECRVGNRWDGDNRVRLLSRVPVPDPFRLNSQRATRRAATEAAVARLEGTALERSADECFRGALSGLHRQLSQVYQLYAERQDLLLKWSEEGRRSGAINEWSALRFAIERKVQLAERIPRLPRSSIDAPAELPAVGQTQPPLRTDPDWLTTLVRRQHPDVALRTALASRYEALADRAASERRPWFDFVDIAYQFNQAQQNAVSGQLAFRVPLGAMSSAGVGRYEALRHGQARDADRTTLEQTRAAEWALEAIRRFEQDTPLWQELLELASRADVVAERWWQGRLASPEEAADLFDEAFDARSVVLEARVDAGLAGCRLLAATGVALANWPRGPVLAQDAPIGRREGDTTMGLPQSVTPFTPLVSDRYPSNPSSSGTYK